MAKDINSIIDDIYRISEQHEKAKHRQASLKGRKEEIEKRSDELLGISTIEELSKKRKSLKQELQDEEDEIIKLYTKIRKDFNDD